MLASLFSFCSLPNAAADLLLIPNGLSPALLTLRFIDHDVAQRQMITMAKKKAIIAPTQMKTKFVGRLDFCMNGALAVGGTVATGVVKVEGAGMLFEVAAPVVIAGRVFVPVADAVFAADEAEEGSVKGGKEATARTLGRKSKRERTLEEHGIRIVDDILCTAGPRKELLSCSGVLQVAGR